MPRAYLDHASTSPLRPAAFEAMLPYLRDHFGDPGRLHDEGRTTRVAVEIAREQVAALFGARAERSGVHVERHRVGQRRGVRRAHPWPEHGRTHIVTTAVEHSAVLEAAHRDPATSHGRRGRPPRPLRCGRVIAALDDDTALVAIQLANHEVGTIQDVAAVVSAVRTRGGSECRPRRCGRRRRPRAGGVRRARCRPLLGDRAHLGRTVRGGRTARPAWAARPAARARRGAGARPARGVRGRSRDRRVRRGRGRAVGAGSPRRRDARRRSH